MESLPSDIIHEILSRVAAESVLECKLAPAPTLSSPTIKLPSTPSLQVFKVSQVEVSFVPIVEDQDLANKNIFVDFSTIHLPLLSNSLFTLSFCVIFTCHIVDPGVHRCLLFHGGQLSDRVSIDEKYIYSQNLDRIYHPPMHEKGLYRHLVGSCN
ncbi:hypothetical protein MKW98_006149, partial [Papaver atlanticum]